MNANGKKIDVWLIYQCEKCKQTYNLNIYERVKPSVIGKTEYARILANDETLAHEYGLEKELFRKNKAEVCMEDIKYAITKSEADKPVDRGCEDLAVSVQNSYEIKVRTDKLIARILDMPREKVRRLEKKGLIVIPQKHIGQYVEIKIYKSRFPDYKEWRGI